MKNVKVPRNNDGCYQGRGEFLLEKYKTLLSVGDIIPSERNKLLMILISKEITKLADPRDYSHL